MSSRPPAPRRSPKSGNDSSARNPRAAQPNRGAEPTPNTRLARGKQTSRNTQTTRRAQSQPEARTGNSARPTRGTRPVHAERQAQDVRPVRGQQASAASAWKAEARTRTVRGEQPPARSRTAQTASTRTRAAQAANARTTEAVSESSGTTSSSKRRRSGRDWNVVLSGSEKTRQFSLRLALVIATVMIGVFLVSSPLRGYIAQQEEKRELLSTLDHRKERVQELEQQLALWNDPQYIQSQARQRLGYVLPGQTLYTVDPQAIAGAQPKEQEQLAELNKERRAATPFYMTMWDSISIAGQSGAVDNPSNVPVINNNK
ncbi:cell division protein FtsB [Arcanobacterium pluranimalium]|uniref:FtsB family cell division protein n=1 Tax=Arcanobacterium pluranimalium TaxID=108028 RepID=UPI0019588188|nr:septum formation initiator family protein [Arcanobacterium pluranimalium]MBM7824800.1 cell division protein FtsB [Arcanobacterium pluranimalium]